jgi:hypothetical protein
MLRLRDGYVMASDVICKQQELFAGMLHACSSQSPGNISTYLSDTSSSPQIKDRVFFLVRDGSGEHHTTTSMGI